MSLVKTVAADVKAKADKAWSFTKKLVVFGGVWGLTFSLVTIGRLGVAFDYDDTLVFSTPAFKKAFDSGIQPYSPAFWEVVNNSYELEERKPLVWTAAWLFRVFGFKVAVISTRPPHGGEALKKEWRNLATSFYFAGGALNKHRLLKDGRYVLYFGDSDSDISEGRMAKVLTLRVKRSPKSTYKEDYNPGKMGELVIPFTEL
ncbi:MAG: hypothetical protein HY928_15515 [Elusimicrobia bacterium]|nr:hypothetical protein [Elusimicrobiota bacterium]